MVPGLPENGMFRCADVELPPGRRIYADGPRPVAWVTGQTVENPGRQWRALLRLHGQTGLVPVLLDPDDASGDFWFTDPVEPTEIDHVDPLDVLGEAWGDGAEIEGKAQLDDFPFAGLAPAEGGGEGDESIESALASFAPAHIGLIAADRPADALAAAGWIVFDNLRDHSNGVWIGSVLRSFEDRFGARLLKVGPAAEIRLLVERPPRTIAAATRVAVEHVAFADDWPGSGAVNVTMLAPHLVDARIWSFWWD
jgi:hypothetical protein